MSPLPIASSSRLSPPRISTSTPSRRRLSRSSSSRSDLSSPGDMRHWTPTRAIVLTSIEGREGRGKVTAKESLGDAERGLSSLYVENERLAGSRESPPKRNRKTWGGTLVSGAMNAGVFGAALGLTAYRMLSGEERDSPAPSNSAASTVSSRNIMSGTSCSSASTSAGPSSIRSRPDSVELPPPPAYSESSHHELVTTDSTGSTEKDSEAWEDLAEVSGAKASLHSRTSSKSLPRQYRHRQHRLSRGKILKTPSRSVASITVEDVLSPLSQQPPPAALTIGAHGPGQNASVGDDSEEEVYNQEACMDPGEVLRRLDAMGDTLQAMIAEARKALALPSPVVVETEGWVDEMLASATKTGRGKTPSAGTA